MTTIRIATFNAENLFGRYNFRENFNPTSNSGFSINNLAFDLFDLDSKKITAKAIKETDADVVCLQEVESMEVLERFVSRYLGGQGYKYRMLVDSHDPRRIDVAVISRLPITSTTTYRHERNTARTSWLFSRDCLVVTVEKNGKLLCIFNNHFKSMMGGRNETHDRRKEQVDKVSSIVDDLFSEYGYRGNFVVVGDFNDYPGGNTSLTSLLNHPGLENVMNRIPEDQRWTHYWAGGNDYKLLDFILLSKSLANNNMNSPVIVRAGLPYRAEKYIGERFPDVGENLPKASDHCPVYFDIDIS